MTSTAGISVSPDFLMDGEEGMSIFVETDEVAAAAAALTEARKRLYLVAADGREFVDQIAAEQAAEVEDGNFYTPSWVSDVSVTPAGAHVVIDTDAGTPGAQAATMAKIVTHALTAHGVSRAVIRPMRAGD